MVCVVSNCCAKAATGSTGLSISGIRGRTFGVILGLRAEESAALISRSLVFGMTH